MRSVFRGIDRITVTFDEANLVANAGLLLVATLVQRLGLESLLNSTIDLSGRVGGFRPGRKVLTLVHAMVAGATHIDHADLLRAGATAKVLSHRVMAPSTLDTFLRSFTFGHVRQFEKVIGESLVRAWALGMGPGGRRLVVDIDSTICAVAGKHKQGAAYGYTKKLGYHPMVATRSNRRDPPRPDAQGLGQHRPGRPALRRRARSPAPPGRCRRHDRRALRLGLLVEGHHRHPPTSRRVLHDGCAHGHGGRDQGHRRHCRGRLGPHRLPRRRPRRRGRLHLPGSSPGRAAHPVDGSPGDPFGPTGDTSPS